MQQPPANNRATVRPILQPRQFEHIRDILADYSGIYLDKTNMRTLTLGIAQRMVITGLSLEAYIEHIGCEAGRDERHRLSELITNHETILFRNMLHMRALQEWVLPRLHKHKKPDDALRIWSAGCSTGEEAYSIAVVTLESLGFPLPRPVEIWATDLSEAALEKARQGVYRGRAFTNTKADVRMRYFEHQGDGWKVRDRLRNLVTFEQLNLLEPFPEKAQGVDIIFCQNVTIYFQLPTFRNLVERFYHILPEGGILFLGFSETLWNVFDKFRLQEIMGAFAYVKPPAGAQPVPTAAQRTTASILSSPTPMHESHRMGHKPRTNDQTVVRKPVPPRVTRPSRLSKVIEPPKTHQNTTTVPGAVAHPTPGAQSTDMEIIERGQDLLAEGRADEALVLLDQLPLTGEHAPRILALIARAHANRGDFDMAVVEARRALELNTLTVEAYLLLGMLYAQQGQLLDAVQHLERARYLDPDSAIISYHLAEGYRQLQRPNIALREYRNTLHKLAGYPPDVVLDGVAIRWLQETCERHIQQLENTRS